jgi:proteasome lid subunit RPN8/RPN11
VPDTLPALRSDPSPALVLPPEPRAVLEAAARARHPREACGLLLGRRTNATTTVELALEAANLCVEDASTRFELDPVAHLAAERRARELGLEIVGVWHSHPERPARPSELDRAGAWGSWSTVIVSVRAGVVVELRSWRLVGASFVEERVLRATTS